MSAVSIFAQLIILCCSVRYYTCAHTMCATSWGIAQILSFCFLVRAETMCVRRGHSVIHIHLCPGSATVLLGGRFTNSVRVPCMRAKTWE